MAVQQKRGVVVAAGVVVVVVGVVGVVKAPVVVVLWWWCHGLGSIGGVVVPMRIVDHAGLVPYAVLVSVQIYIGVPLYPCFADHNATCVYPGQLALVLLVVAVVVVVVVVVAVVVNGCSIVVVVVVAACIASGVVVVAVACIVVVSRERIAQIEDSVVQVYQNSIHLIARTSSSPF